MMIRRYLRESKGGGISQKHLLIKDDRISDQGLIVLYNKI